MLLLSVLFAGAAVLAQENLWAEDYQAEVMAVEGQVYRTPRDGQRVLLKEGDLVSVGDTVESGASGTADLAFDSDWNNVSRIEEGTTASIESIYPTKIDLQKGGVFSTLKALPSGSSFEVQTPTAVASVRGSEYRVTHDDSEGTQAFNFSESPVYVYGMDESGSRALEQLVIANAQKMEVPRRGMKMMAPKPMMDREMQMGKRMDTAIHDKSMNMRAMGKVGKIQGLDRVKQEMGRRNGPGGRPGVEGRKEGPGNANGLQNGPRRRENHGPNGQKPNQNQNNGGDKARRNDNRNNGGNHHQGPPKK